MDILGIEIRTDTLAVVHLKGSFLSLKARSYEILGGETLEARLAGLKGYISQYSVKGPRMAIVLPRSSAVSGTIDLPAPGPSAIGGILRFELEKHIPFDPGEVYWDFDIVEKKKNIFSVLFAAAKKSAVDKIVDGFRASGLEPYSAEFWQASVGTALTHCRDSAPGRVVAVAGMSAKEVTLDVFSDFVPVYSMSAGAGRLKEDDLPGALKRELEGFLRSKAPSSERKVDRFAVVSGQTPEKRVMDELSQDLGQPIPELCLNGFKMPCTAAAALGAALAAAGRGRVNIGLLPSSAQKTADSGYMQKLALTTSIAALLLLTGATYIIKDRLALSRLDSAVEEARAGKKKMQGLADSLNDLSERVRVLDEIKGSNSPGALDVMKELTMKLPADTWLTDFEYNKGVVSFEGFSDRASRQLIDMERSGFMKDVEFTGPVTKGSGGKEHFRIKFKVMDYKEMEKTGKAEK